MRTPARRTLLISVLALAAYALGLASARYRWLPYVALERAGTWVAALFGGGRETKGAGMWHRLRPGTTTIDPDQYTPAELANVPYLSGFRTAPTVQSVTVHDAAAAHDGLNLVLSGHAPRAFLQDMKGNTLHEWHRELAAMPGLSNDEEHPAQKTYWRRAHVFPDGDLLGIFEGIGMFKLDRDSNLLWVNDRHCHHDIHVDEHGSIWTLSREQRQTHDRLRLDGPILEDFVTVLSPDGVEQRRVSVLQCFLDSDYASWLSLAAKRGDILHTNALLLMDGRFADRHPLYAKGNVMVSVPALNVIAVIDMQRERVVWALGGLWQFQHRPLVVDDGNLLVFDNLGENGNSKMVEIDPLTQRVVWSYRHSKEQPFGSFFLGFCQRLPNGNTLITESTAGRAFEVTRAGKTVWEYVNPNRAPDDPALIATLLEVVRIERGYFAPEFAAAHNDYATGKLEFDLTELEALAKRLERGER